MTPDNASEGFTAMGSTARLEVLRALVKAGHGGRPVSEIQTTLGIPASTLTHHLKVLADARLIVQEKAGRSIISRANYDQLEALAAFILSECCSEEGNRND
ncbi:ArsR/SmtB family transcription factor [Salaquimonas pukyongi]|uniref:ArsR/SmtB family transcription factor n=1 Tax=Salaquimonas pukyongi TaxID=2712698 RepID=UPI00096BCDE0|nr:metalloregulator ArsR/SmtB family transcription factor [Salaquimonas pukyongi]